MLQPKIVVIATFLIFTIVLLLHSLLLVGEITLSTAMINLIFLAFVWWLGKKYQRAYKDAEQLKITEEQLKKIQEKQQQLMEDKEVIEQTIDRVDDIAIYSLNKITGEFYISKGAEKIYGYSPQRLMDNPNLWMQVVHPGDKEKQEIREKKLFFGEPVITELRIVRPDGEVRWVIQRDTPIKDDDEKIITITGNIIDITERKGLELKLRQLAYFDELTDLANRTLLERQLRKALSRSKRLHHHLCVMFIDLDGFKNVNDTLGHEAGDQLLKEVAHRLKNSVRDEDFIARLGGDEFIIIFEETEKEEVQVIAQRILENVSETYEIGDKQANISPSMGITIFPENGEDQESLLKNADRAMYFAKSKGKANFQFYSEDLPEPSSNKSFFEKLFSQFQGGFSR